MSIRSTLIQPTRRRCPMCDALGFRKVRDDFFGEAVLRCSTCAHEWTARAGTQGSNRTPTKESEP